MANYNKAYKNATESPLLQLPPEIRNIIFELVLGGNKLHLRLVVCEETGVRDKPKASLCLSDEDEELVAHAIRSSRTQTADANISFRDRHDLCYDEDEDDLSRYHYSIGLVRTCSQIYSETYLLPFQANTFVLDNRMAFTAFIAALRPVQRRAISKVVIFRLRQLLEGIDRDRRGRLLRGKWSRKTLSGLRNVTVFEEVLHMQDYHAAAQQEKLLDQRQYFLKKLPMLTGATLTSVTVSAFHLNPTYTDPELFHKHCEMIEEMLLSLWKVRNEWRRLKAFSDHDEKAADKLWSKCVKAFENYY